MQCRPAGQSHLATPAALVPDHAGLGLAALVDGDGADGLVLAGHQLGHEAFIRHPEGADSAPMQCSAVQCSAQGAPPGGGGGGQGASRRPE